MEGKNDPDADKPAYSDVQPSTTGQPNQPNSPNSPNPSNQPNQQNQKAPGSPEPSPKSAKFDVTPESPIKINSQIPPKPIKKIHQTPKTRIILAAVVLLLAIALLFIGINVSKPHYSTTSTSITTTIKTSTFSKINSCSALNSPGTYYLSSNVKYTKSSGTCMNITASNVSLICNGNSLTGTGPYGSKPPFTYGIAISGSSNVLVSGCSISNFSYGIFSHSSNNLSLKLNNVSRNVMAEIWLSNTSNSNVSDNFLSKSLSREGALYLSNGSVNNIVLNNTIALDAFYGINVSSSGNKFVSNYLYGSPESFICSLEDGFVESNKGAGNICVNETGCSFLSCKGVNIPPNITKVTLSPTINSCGSITFPGRYRLSGNINMNSIINISNPLAYSYPCISIDSPNVELNCSGFAVSNATTAFYVNGVNNASINDCKISHAISGISVFNSTNVNMQNVHVMNTPTAFSYTDSKGGVDSNVSAAGGTYGLYLSSSDSVTFNNFNFSNNVYGAYVTSSLANIFSSGVMHNNTKFDLYASLNSANSSDGFMQSTSCGLTNAAWATCTQHISPSAKFFPVSSCSTINKPGNYSLQNNLVSTSQYCFNIKSSNVAFSCAGHSITLSASSISGFAFGINGLKNVSISNCTISNFPYGVTAYNSSHVSIEGSSIANPKLGILLSNTTNSTVSNNYISGASNSSIMLSYVSDSQITENNMTGTASDYGIAVFNSSRNYIYRNIGSKNGVGILLQGHSINNTVLNNTMQISSVSDYVCAPQDSGIDAEFGGINYGTSKQGCHWLAAVSPLSPFPSCTAFLNPGIVELSADYEYTFGSLCYGVYANATTINCNGHTVISDSNGTFAFFKNSRDSVIENCYLKGFTIPIKAYNSSVDVINNTIYLVHPNSTAILVSNSTNSNIRQNHVFANGTGIALSHDSFGSIQNNLVNASSISYLLEDSSGVDVKNNTALQGSGIGMSLVNSTAGTFQNNRFYGVADGLLCSYASQASTNNTDLGGNICSSEINCNWISASKTSCP